MIAIRYSGKQLPKYEALCTKLQKKISVWLNLGYVGNANSNIIMDADTRKFFNVLNHPNAIRKLANLSALHLVWLMDMIDNQFPKLLDDRLNKEANPNCNVSTLYKCIDKAFSKFGYESATFPSEELMNDLDLAVCPYCNRNFIKSIRVKQNAAGRDIYVKGQLDHFYPRSLYPYLAICKHNLVPSCPSCNGASGKHDENTRTIGVVSPYLLSNSNEMKFKMAITDKGFADLRTCAQAISIDIDCTANPALANNENIFHLKKIYATHTDYAAEVYYKSILRLPDSYLSYVREKMVSKGQILNAEDIKRILWGVCTQEQDYKKRPLSKFCTDIARQRKLLP